MRLYVHPEEGMDIDSLIQFLGEFRGSAPIYIGGPSTPLISILIDEADAEPLIVLNPVDYPNVVDLPTSDS